MAPFKAYKIQPDNFKDEEDVEEGSNTNISELDSSNDENERSSLLSFSSGEGHSLSSEINHWTLDILNEEDRDMYERDTGLLGLKFSFFR